MNTEVNNGYFELVKLVSDLAINLKTAGDKASKELSSKVELIAYEIENTPKDKLKGLN